MAHWYTSCQGSRGLAHRLGGKDGGARANVASYSGQCRVVGFVNDKGEDCVNVFLDTWKGSGTNHVIYAGPISRFEPQGGAK